jgi:hypothetical protein
MSRVRYRADVVAVNMALGEELLTRLELNSKAEPLLHELRPFAHDKLLHHPLIVEYVEPDRAAVVNARYRDLRRQADDSIAEEDWSGYIFCMRGRIDWTPSRSVSISVFPVQSTGGWLAKCGLTARISFRTVEGGNVFGPRKSPSAKRAWTNKNEPSSPAFRTGSPYGGGRRASSRSKACRGRPTRKRLVGLLRGAPSRRNRFSSRARCRRKT